MEEGKITQGVDESLYSEKSLFLLNIKELRDLGRKFGVPSPTTMKKKELVDYILKVVYGEITAPIKNSYGRPSVREFDLDKCIEKIKKNVDVSDELKTATLENFGTMKVASYKEVPETGEIETRVYFTDGNKCYLRVRQFVESKGDIEIPQETANKFHLQNFDVVEVIVSDDMFKIVSINAKKIETKFDKLFVDKNKITSGVTRDFYLRTKEKVKQEIEELSKSCEVENIKLIVVGRNKYAGKNTDSITYSPNEDKSSLYKKLIQVVGFGEKAVFEGHDFVLAIEDADEFEEIANSFDKDISSRVKKYIRTALPKFTFLGNSVLLFRVETENHY